MSEWLFPTQPYVLPPQETHVWRISLMCTEDALTRRAALLTADEWARAERFRRPQDRHRFILARSALRLVLADSLEVAADALRFDYGPQGKPTLARPLSDLSFNLSHSDALALVAVRHGGPLGVDVERVRDDFDGDEIAERFFCPAERAWLNSLPPERSHDGFFRLWTRKEAYIKARGAGLWQDLTAFDVSQSPPLPVRQQGTVIDLPWYIQDLAPGAGYRAALAVEGPWGMVRLWQWPPDDSGNSLFGA